MVLEIGEDGLVLDSSARAMAGLPAQAFAISLSSSVIEDMIACVQDGGDIQLSLGSNPAFLFNDRSVRIPKSTEPTEYDLFHSNSHAPETVYKLPNPAMSIFDKARHKKPKAPAKAAAKTEKKTTAKASKPPAKQPSPPLKTEGDASPTSDLGDAIENLKNSYAKVKEDKLQNSAVVVGSLRNTKGKVLPGGRLLGSQPASLPRSLPTSPALTGGRSPSVTPAGNSQDKLKQHRVPIIHELAVQDLAFRPLFDKWDKSVQDPGTESEFSLALSKVADFDESSQKWQLKKIYWKELDVFEYDYPSDEVRQQAIENARRQYDRQRLAASDDLWQKLLPKSERGKGVCLSKLQAAIARGPTAPATKTKSDRASPSGGDSEKDESASSVGKRKGGEPMSRSSSQTSTTGKKKLSASEAQAKRLLSNTKKPAAASKPSPKVSPAKPAAKVTAAKGGRVLSKEFVTDSDSDNDEEPLSTSLSKARPPVAASKPVERAVDRSKAAAAAPKVRVALPTKAPAREKEEKSKDTIRAQVASKPLKPTTKRQRDADDDDSSSSGTPLSKRVKPTAKQPIAASVRVRASSETSQNGRIPGSVSAVSKKLVSPTKPSPLASSPPPNAPATNKDRRMLARMHERERVEIDREMVISSASSNDGSSVEVAVTGKKRPVSEALSSDSSKAKRQRLSPRTLKKAQAFKLHYAKYEALHHEVAADEDPDPDMVSRLMDMRERLTKMKEEIYAEAPMEA